MRIVAFLLLLLPPVACLADPPASPPAAGASVTTTSAPVVAATDAPNPPGTDTPATTDDASSAGPAATIPTVGAPPKLDLERLLKPRTGISLPSTLPSSRGTKTRDEWQRDFAALRTEVVELEAEVEEAKRELREGAGSDWGYSPAGGALPTDPAVLRLRARLKRDRRSLETARRRLRELKVEASLAGVPESWREPEPSAP